MAPACLAWQVIAIHECLTALFGPPPIRNDERHPVATITAPTLVVHGTADTLITLGGGRRTAEVIPGAELVVVEGWGHDMAPGAWPQLIDAISTHCHRVDGTD